jgi:tetratricopeptide (TPR) repeat protein
MDSRVVTKMFSMIIAFCILTSCAGIVFRTGAETQFEDGLALFNQGRYAEAIPHFEKATSIDPNYGKAYLYLGRSYLNLRKWAQAIPPLRTAYRLIPDETRSEIFNILLDAILNAGLSEFKQGNYVDSITFLREALRLDPSSAQAKKELVAALIGRGGQLLSEGKTAEAISTYTEAVDLSPNDSGAYLGLARSFFKNGDIVKAIQAAEKAMRMNPGNSDAELLFRELMGR